VRTFTRSMPAIDRLRALPLLEAATDEELGHIDRMMCEVEISAGKAVTSEGDRPQGFFLIVSGSAAVTVAGLERGVLGAGMFFGETALLDGAPEPATVTAITPMLLRVATGEEFARLSEVRSLTWAILQTLAARQRLALGDGPRLTAVPAEIGAAS
jgi:CRP-like cAMP-binding protein